ncbi:hypothetical protein [Pseudomonas putida]
MKKFLFMAVVSFAVSACSEPVTYDEAKKGAKSTYDQFSQCLADNYKKSDESERDEQFPNAVIAGCADSLAAHVEYEYSAANSAPNMKPMRESHDEFSERVTAEKVDEARGFIKLLAKQNR